jgi:hypothetical protein
VLVGDRPGKDITADTINMIKFWEEDPFKDFKGLDTRIAQLRMFEYMRKSGIDLLSIGMRSGAMEGPALLGIPTIYIEETGNKQHERMEKWLGKVPGWGQMQVGTLPTRTGKRYQDEGSYVPGKEKAVDDAIGDVVTETATNWDYVTGVLYPNYDADWGKFVGNVKLTLKLRYLDQRVTKAMGRWHRAYSSHRIVLKKLYAAEDVVVRETAKSASVVGSALREGGGGNVNVGLADYLRIVLPKLKPAKPPVADKEKSEAERLEEQRLEAEKLAAITKSIRAWRAIWVGKSELAKGFKTDDLNNLLYSPQLRADTIANVQATKDVLLRRIDSLSGEDAGTAAGRLASLDWAEPQQFVNNYILLCAFPLKSYLKLGGPRETRESVQTRAIAHGKTTAGSTWWNGFDTSLKQLHTALFPLVR